VLKDAGSGLGGRPHARLRHALVVGEVAVSLALLVLAGLALRSLANAHSIDPGFEANGVTVASLDPGLAGRDRASARRFLERFDERLRLVPGVEAVSTVQPVPLSLNVRVSRLRTDADQARPAKDLPFIDTALVGPDYFRALRVGLVSGREFLSTDDESHQRVAIVNETMARKYWPGESPLGRRVAVGFPQPTPVAIVGVVRDTKSRTLGDQPRPFIYTCARQDPMGWQSATVVVRARGTSQEVGQSIRSLVHQLDPEMPVYGIQTLPERIGVAYALPRYALTLFGAFAALALLLASVGLYGVVAYAVSQRTREIGLRMAFGADRARIFRLIVGEALWLGGVGVLLGAPIAFVLSRAASAFLYGVGVFDALTLIGTATLMIVVCCVAAYVPAQRAASIDPMVALRYH
jgi:predicted permease